MNINYKIRILVIFLIFCVLYLILLFNLYVIQIKNRNFYINLAERQYNVTITTTPPRAPIIDRNGNCLALNKDVSSAFILPKKIQDKKQLEAFLQEYFPDALERFYKNKDLHFMFIKRKLNEEQLELVKNIKDIYILKEPNRFYPIECTGIITGLTNIDNNGLFGIEKQYDKILKGKPTKIYLEKDARYGHFYFNKETIDKGQQGEPVKLTIDTDLQFLVYEELKERISSFEAKEGAIIIMNPSNGEILSMVSYPDFNPNNTENLIIENSKNRCISSSHELGSVMKVFTALGALEEGIVTPDEKIDCENSKTAYLDGVRVNTWRAFGIMSFSDVIEKSNNIGIAKIAKRLDYKLYDYLDAMGFGKKTNIKLLGEAKGFVNHPQNWSKLSIYSLSYGYEASATLMQLAKSFSIIANNGYDVYPKIILEPHDEDIGINNQKPIISEKTIIQVKKILENTVLKGTARKAGIKGYKMMAKTGTANLVVNGKYDSTKNVFDMAGIIEKDGYKRVIVVYVKEISKKGLYAAQVVVPLFEKIAEKMLIHDKIIL